MKNLSFKSKINNFYCLITQLKNVKQAKKFFNYLCSGSELEELVKRFMIIEKIEKRESIESIINEFPEANYFIAKILSRLK